MAKNTVIAGDYVGARVYLPGWLMGEDSPAYISTSDGDLTISKHTVANIGVVDETTKSGLKSGVIRAAMGGLVLGPIGLAAGLTARSSKEITLSVDFKNGKRCMIEVDNEIYKRILKCMY